MALEDFTAWSPSAFADPNGRFSVAANTITVTGLTRGENAWVADDKGAGHFSASFTHLIDFTVTAITSIGACAVWMIANVLDDFGAADYGGVVFWYGTGPKIHCRARGGSDDTSVNLSTGTHYWLEIEYDSTVGTYGTLYCRIYSDSGRTTLVDTLSSAFASAAPSEQYIYAADSYAVSGGTSISLTINNLDLQEGGGGGGGVVGAGLTRGLKLDRMRLVA